MPSRSMPLPIRLEATWAQAAFGEGGFGEMDRVLSAPAPSPPLPLPKLQLCPLPPTPSASLTPVPPLPLPRVRHAARVCAHGARPEGNSHCLQDSWGPPPPGSPRSPHPSPAGGRGCSRSRPASGTATALTTTASSRLMPRGSSQPGARWPSQLRRGLPGNARRRRLP